MNHSGVSFCKCNSTETAECNLGFPSLHWLQLGDQIKFPQSAIERGIAVGCIKHCNTSWVKEIVNWQFIKLWSISSASPQ